MKQKGIQTKAVKGATTSLELAADRKRKPDTVLTTEEAEREASTLHNEADEEGSKFVVYISTFEIYSSFELSLP